MKINTVGSFTVTMQEPDSDGYFGIVQAKDGLMLMSTTTKSQAKALWEFKNMTAQCEEWTDNETNERQW